MSNPALQDLIAQTRATLETIAGQYGPAVFASSLAAEDMVLTDMILREQICRSPFHAGNRPPARRNAGHAGLASVKPTATM